MCLHLHTLSTTELNNNFFHTYHLKPCYFSAINISYSKIEVITSVSIIKEINIYIAMFKWHFTEVYKRSSYVNISNLDGLQKMLFIEKYGI